MQSCHITCTLFCHNPFFCNKTPFVWRVLISQSYCHTSESLPADTSGCSQRINSVCLMFNYTLINTHQTRMTSDRSAGIELMLSAVTPENQYMSVDEASRFGLIDRQNCGVNWRIFSVLLLCRLSKCQKM